MWRGGVGPHWEQAVAKVLSLCLCDLSSSPFPHPVNRSRRLLSPPPPLNREYDAETLFLDTATDTGVVVRPKPGRAVLMDQDVLHR